MMPGDTPVTSISPEPGKLSLGRQIAKGAVFMIALRGVFRLFGLVSALFLLRILAPSDFGVVGLVTAALAVLELLSELSFQAGIIRMKNPARRHYDTAWTLGLLRNAVLAAGLVAAAPLLAKFVDEPRTVSLAYALAAITILQGLENIGVVDFQRRMQFDRFFRFQIFGKLAGVCTAVPLAFWLRDYWALMGGIAVTRLSMTALSYVVSDYRPKLSLAAWHDLFDFSKWLLVGNLQWVLDVYVMTFVVGRIAGPAAIGLYQVANRVAALPASEVAAPIRTPMYAGLSRTVDDMAQLRRQTLDGLFLSVAVVAPMSVGIALMAQPIVDLFFGWKWVDAIPLVRMCALAALFDAIGHYAHTLYLVTHHQRRFVGVFSVALAVRIPAIVLSAAFYGVDGAAFALMATAVFNSLLWTANIFPQIGIPVRAVFTGTWRTVFACLAMTAMVLWLSTLWPEPRDFWLGLVRFGAICGLGAATHLAAQFAAWRLAGEPAGAERHLIKSAREAAERLTPRAWARS